MIFNCLAISASIITSSESRTTVLRACLDIVATWIVRSDQRRALRELAQEGRLLSDVGLTRVQALLESGKPFWRR
jgi:uncharacterized protein YjiS (DUF1127 family)